ncbi:hypothetical protein DVQ41_17370 [Yersinia enterocolitica]|nr:hypothetical protein [Yersinia enterocolitica]QBP98960.1 hypothetical protein YEY1_09325 [Yersinia enterocolitica subsp. palearctica]EKN4927650.1 hypothetical protein [Yersinia enterocolitica]EKN4931654.1 hypothetical protein [Yersinia enterocolitica]EKN5013924.1 hypothetical protein [Yersinia enterocolitica]
MRLLTKCPQRRKQVDHKDAVLLLLKQASLMARAAILGADALLFYLSSPYNIESSRFVSSLTLTYSVAATSSEISPLW